jgi:hypothetical protein
VAIDLNDPSSPASNTAKFKRLFEHRTQSVHVATDGHVWVATLENGLFRMGEKTVDRPFPDGMNFETDILHAVGEDANGDFWVISSEGFNKLDKHTGEATNFDSRWGFETQYFWVHNSTIASDGRIYFPSRNGLLFFDPDEIGFRQELLKPIITSIEGFDQNAWPEAKTLRISTKSLAEKGLTFDHHDAVLTFNYSALFYPEPSAVEYQSMLTGVDEDWTEPVVKSSISYPLLPPGKYKFQVRSRIIGQSWGEVSQAIGIRVLNPVYFRWWFVLGVFLGITLLVYLFLQLRLRKIREQHMVLEGTVSTTM